MPTVINPLLERITVDPAVRFGRPCIRGHRIAVQEVLEWLSSGATPEQIMADYPQLEPEDFRAIYAYAAELRSANVGKVKLLLDEGLSPKLLDMLGELFPGSESALRNGLARQGDLKAEAGVDIVPVFPAIGGTALLAVATGWLASYRTLGQKSLEILRDE
jgi:uncharacterized protein (DUF433 family)